ncbi:MAG TPA: GNAT family N-acetyltransferase [Nocardioidaceae bacterium]|nr:GNAT family N-acetyltransferase [Nocardioidaceae bacterium]
MDWSLRDNSDRHRFEITRGDEIGGWVDYEQSDEAITLVHTEVDPAFEGEGLGSKLARGALDEARSRRLPVLPVCSFIAGYIQRHDEYVDLVPSTRRTEFGVG